MLDSTFPPFLQGKGKMQILRLPNGINRFLCDKMPHNLGTAFPKFLHAHTHKELNVHISDTYYKSIFYR